MLNIEINPFLNDNYSYLLCDEQNLEKGEWIYYNEDGSIKSVETHKKESSE